MIHKPRPVGDRLFLRAVAAVLFAAVCAYAGEGLFSAASARLGSSFVSYESITESVELHGLALRREEALPAQNLLPLAESGDRLPAGAAAALGPGGEAILTKGSALYLDTCDGFESLSPALLDTLDAATLEALLKSPPPSEPSSGRLVYGHDWYYVSALPGDAGDFTKGPCLLDFGLDRPTEARLAGLKSDGEETLAVFRLRDLSGELLSLRRCTARLILARHEGCAVPAEAVSYDGEGGAYVQVCSALGSRQTPVEIIHKTKDRCLVKALDENALREGDRVLK